MAKLRLNVLFSIVGMFFMVYAYVLPAQAQSWDPKDKGQMRQLASETCLKTRDEKVCSCFTEQLMSNFNEKEWRIFVADQTQSATPPSGIVESDLDSYGRKLAAAGNSCGM